MKSWGETGRKVKEGKIERKFIGGRKRKIKEELGETGREFKEEKKGGRKRKVGKRQGERLEKG